MTFNTGNPIGSTDARDRSDNSENLDLAVNSLSQTFVDRLGVTRDTLEGIYQKSAYYRAGTFDAGYTLTNNRQTLAYGNIEYSWSGVFPKVVAASSTPETTGGIGAGAWVDRTDVTLRSELLATDGTDHIYFGANNLSSALINTNAKLMYVTDYTGCYADIGLVINNMLNTAFSEGKSARIIIPFGLYTNVTSVQKTIPAGLSVEIIMQAGAHILCNTDQLAFGFTATDSSCSFHLGGHGRISAHFGVNSTSATCLKVTGFSFPKSMVIDGTITIGTSEANVNWKTALHIIDSDSVMVSGMYIQDATTVGVSTATAILIESVAKQTMDCKFIGITTGGHKYFLRAVNNVVGTGLEGLQMIDCSLSGSCHIENLVSLLVYQPPQIWFKGCHINNMSSCICPITIIGFNDIRINDCTVFTYGGGLIALDSCSDAVIDNVDLYYLNGYAGDAIYLASSNGVCSNLYVNRFIDKSTSNTGSIVHMSSSNINTITIANSKKNNLDKPWVLNDAGVNWDTISVSGDLDFGVSNADARLLTHSTLSPVGSFDAAPVVGSIVRLTSSGTVNSISGRIKNCITFVCEASGQVFVHGSSLLLSKSTNAVCGTAGGTITFVHQGNGIYREVGRTF